MDEPMTDTNELRKLLEKATPGPWRVQFTGGGDSWQVVGSNARREAFDREAFDDGSACGEYRQSCTDPTRDLIVAAVNALPALLDELDGLRAELRRMSEWHDQIADTVPCDVAGPHYGIVEWHRMVLAERDAARAEVERLRADLREAMELLDAVTDKEPETQAQRWLLNRVNALLAKHKETP
jgi:hypothetical protein